MNNGLLKLLVGILAISSFQIFAQNNTVGVTDISDKVQEGYTLFAPNSSRSTYLIDNCGNIINEWTSVKTPGLSAYLMPNGDLVRTRRESNITFFAGGTGGGIEIFNWQGMLIWEFVLSDSENLLHHDIAVLPNGNILAIAFESVSQSEVVGLGRELASTPADGMWTDMIIEIKPLPNNDFEIVWEWHAIDHLVQNTNPSIPNFSAIEDAPERLDFNYSNGGQGGNTSNDWMHCNAIDYNETLDQIILNSRNFNEFFIIDHSTTTEEARGGEGGRYGKGGDLLYRWGNPAAYNTGSISEQRLFGQHDAHWIDEGLKDGGKVFVFNNGINRPGGFATSVDLIETPILSDGTYEKEDAQPFGPTEAEWIYGLEEDHINITSQRISGVSRMPNGNTLITVGGTGRLLELDENLEVAWDYVIPLIGNDPIAQGEMTSVNSVFRSYKYTLDYPAFLSNDIEVGMPIELNPNNGFCTLVSTEEVFAPIYPFKLINTIADNELIIESMDNTNVAVVDINGQILYEYNLSQGIQHVDVSRLSAGMYYIQVLNWNSPILEPQRFIKTN